MLGKEVIKLISDNQVAGSYDTQWNGESTEGLKVAGGMYFYQLSVDGKAETKKMLLIK